MVVKNTIKTARNSETMGLYNISIKDFRDHVSHLYVNLNILKLSDMIILQNVLLVHDDYKHNHSYLTEIFLLINQFVQNQ